MLSLPLESLEFKGEVKNECINNKNTRKHAVNFHPRKWETSWKEITFDLVQENMNWIQIWENEGLKIPGSAEIMSQNTGRMLLGVV
jgi:hypothetical protein